MIGVTPPNKLMTKPKEYHRQGEKRPWRNGTIKYDKHLGWIYHEKGDTMDTVIYAYLIRDMKKIFPNINDGNN